jgi:hypothetical protein
MNPAQRVLVSGFGERERKILNADEHYLGDGAYAYFDKFNALVLYTSDGIRRTNEIFLEPEVLDALLAFIQKSTTEVSG